MLVLSRRVGEKVIITLGEHRVEVMVTKIGHGIDHGKVRLGFNAPKEIAINREEVQDGTALIGPPS